MFAGRKRKKRKKFLPSFLIFWVTLRVFATAYGNS